MKIEISIYDDSDIITNVRLDKHDTAKMGSVVIKHIRALREELTRLFFEDAKT